MFFTLVSKTIITSLESKRDFFYIFMIGCVGYVIVHWYLNMKIRTGVPEMIRKYIYYMMVIDMIIAFVLLQFFPKKKPLTTQTNPLLQPDSSDQKKAIMQKLNEARKLQQQKQKDLEQQNKSSQVQTQTQTQTQIQAHAQAQAQVQKSNQDQINEKKDDKKNEVKDDTKDEKKGEINDDAEKNKKTIFSKSEASDDTDETESQTKKKKKTTNDIVVLKKGKNDVVDTDIPIYKSK